MSDTELYEIARGRIDRRNRRWAFWAADLAGMIIVIGIFILIVDTVYWNLGLFAMMAWIGVFVMHTIILAMAESRDKDIEKELAKLQEFAYEKPKRLELTDDGEIVDYSADDYEAEPRKQQNY